MTLFHQNSPQLSNQLKVFPVRLNEIQLVNVSQQDAVDYFSDYDDALDGISIVAFLPIIVIGILLAILIMFFKIKSLKSNRGQIDRLEEIYQVLETVDQIAADPYAVNSKLIDEIRYALILDDCDSMYYAASQRRDSLYPLDEFLDHPNNQQQQNHHYHLQMTNERNGCGNMTGPGDQLIRLKDEDVEGSQIV